MDYKAFYGDVANWINSVNQQASQLGMQSAEFWAWVTATTSELCNRYDNLPLVLKQMSMLVDWLDEVYDKSKR